jgi:hypothetical protein
VCTAEWYLEHHGMFQTKLYTGWKPICS